MMGERVGMWEWEIKRIGAEDDIPKVMERINGMEWNVNPIVRILAGVDRLGI